MRTSIKSMVVLGGMLTGCAGAPTRLNAITQSLECRAEALAPYQGLLSDKTLAKMMAGDVNAREVLEAAQEAPEKIEAFIQVWNACEED